VKHVTVADKSLLAGDVAVDLLIEYATLLAQQNSADSIDLRAIGSDGDEVIATFLLNGGVTIIAETTTSTAPEPDNVKAEEYMHTRVEHLRGLGRIARPEDISGERIWNAGEEA
jgi:hypothetical protein